MISICWIPHSLHGLFLSSLTCLCSLISWLLSNHYFQFFFFLSVCSQTSVCQGQLLSSIALFWWCHVSFIFLIGLFTVFMPLRVKSPLLAFQTGFSRESLSWSGCESTCWVRCSVFGSWGGTMIQPPCYPTGWSWPIGDLLCPKATEDRQQMGLLVSSESEVTLCLYGEV